MQGMNPEGDPTGKSVNRTVFSVYCTAYQAQIYDMYGVECMYVVV